MPAQTLELTFGLDFLQVGRDDDALDLLQLQVLGDLSKPQHHAPLALGLCVARDTSKLGCGFSAVAVAVRQAHHSFTVGCFLKQRSPIRASKHYFLTRSHDFRTT